MRHRGERMTGSKSFMPGPSRSLIRQPGASVGRGARGTSLFPPALRVTALRGTPRVNETRRIAAELKRQRTREQKMERDRARMAALRTPSHSSAPPIRGGQPMSRGELYAYFKRIGKLQLYFYMFPYG